MSFPAILTLVLAQAASPSPAGPGSPSPAPSVAPSPAAGVRDQAPVTTRHELRTGSGGRALRYSVTTGTLPLTNEAGEVEADIFFIAYTVERTGAAAARPLMFSFNGGPGSSSVWLHLGALGPKRVKMQPDGSMPSPPYTLVDNEATWLEATDLVFIDPVGTGYSRARKPDLGKKFWGLKGDIESVGEFIRLYLTRYERWGSPLFMVGESYGTTRAAGLSGYLIDRGISFNGVLLVSSILNFQTARFTKGNDLPFVVFLPTYTATAWYHKRLPPDLQSLPLAKVIEEVERFAAGDYASALGKGDQLVGEELKRITAALARFTGLSPAWLEQNDLRIEIRAFCKELLRGERRTVGRLDSRFKGIDATAAGEEPDFDPSMAAIRPPYTAMLNDYVRRDLGYKTDLTYHILGGGIGPWEWGSAGEGFPDTSEALRSAFAKNPAMKLFVASGYYDLATPFFATEYTLAHMGLDPTQRPRVHAAEYEAGHMMYIHEGELAKLKKDVVAFLQAALTR